MDKWDLDISYGKCAMYCRGAYSSDKREIVQTWLRLCRSVVPCELFLLGKLHREAVSFIRWHFLVKLA